MAPRFAPFSRLSAEYLIMWTHLRCQDTRLASKVSLMLFDLLMGVGGGTKIFENFRMYLFRYILDHEYTHGGHAPTARSTAPLAIAFCCYFLLSLCAFSFHN